MSSRPAPLAMGEARFRLIARIMKMVLGFVGLLALGSAIAPEPYSEVLGQMAVASLIAAPLLRVLWMAVRWIRRRDYKYSAVALGVFTLALIGFLLG